MNMLTPLVRLLCIGLIVSVALVVIHSSVQSFLDFHNQSVVNAILPQPYLHLQINDHAPSILFHAGDVVYVHTEVARSGKCTVDLNYRIISEYRDDKGVYHRVVYFTYPQTRTVVAPGTYASDVRLEFPQWLLPGDYLIDRNANYGCDGARIALIKGLPFAIIPK